MREETFPAAAAQLWVYDPDEFPQKGLAALLSSILNPSIGRVTTLCYWQLAARKMAATALAIRLHEIDTGSRPEKLADLVGKYLPTLPTDPFAADGRPLGYLPKADKPRLYSINEDGKDDSGEFALDRWGDMRQARDLVFFLNEGDRPLPPCDWYDPTTRPAPKPLLRMGPGGRIEIGPVRGGGSFPPATLPAGR
jgi:hypothetical protein